jgi:hypothetical protein
MKLTRRQFFHSVLAVAAVSPIAAKATLAVTRPFVQGHWGVWRGVKFIQASDGEMEWEKEAPDWVKPILWRDPNNNYHVVASWELSEQGGRPFVGDPSNYET